MNEFFAQVLQLVAACVWPRLRERLATIAYDLLPDLPALSGQWVAHFHDPTPEGSALLAVEVNLKQFGRSLRGEGRILAQPDAAFNFRGMIRRNVFFGSFARQDTRVLAGTGAFILKIIADSRSLRGSCLWYDGGLDDVWVSPYSWRRATLGISRQAHESITIDASVHTPASAGVPHKPRATLTDAVRVG